MPSTAVSRSSILSGKLSTASRFVRPAHRLAFVVFRDGKLGDLVLCSMQVEFSERLGSVVADETLTELKG
jgi:hypothetical protein